MKCDPVSKHRLGVRLPIGSLLACVLLSGGVGTAGVACAQDAAATTKIQKILFLGNSITRHGPKKDIGWSGNWGMAASSEEKDFVHLVASSVAKSQGKAPEIMIRNIATFERQYATYDVAEKLKDAFEFKPDLVIVAIGENVPALTSADATVQFGNGVTKLLQQLKAGSNPTIIVRSCFWASAAKDEILNRACQAVGGVFVDIGPLGKDEANYARSERQFQHKGVAAHPGDRGMQAIANALLDAINNRKGKDK